VGALRSAVVAVVLVTALVAATSRVQAYRDRPYLYTNLYLPSGKFVEQTSLGYRELAADWTWFQAVQYYGGYRLQQHDLAYFNGLIDIVTDLDPHFQFPYIFGAVVMSQDMGDLERGVEILKKGMRANPGDWNYPFEIGFLYYVIGQDANRAARYFELASRLPGSGEIPARFAAFVYSKAGHGETSIRMWEEIARESNQPAMRDLAKRYIEKIRAGDQSSGSTQQPTDERKREGNDS